MGSNTMQSHRNLIKLQKQKIARSNYWRPIITKELAISSTRNRMVH